MLYDLFIEIIGSIKRNKLRSAATGFAVTSGIFLLIVLLGAGNGVIHTLENNVGTLALDAVYVYPGFTSSAYQGYSKEQRVQINESDGELAQKVAPDNIKNYTAQFSTSVTARTEDEKKLSTNLAGVGPIFHEMMGLQVVKGRFLNEIDMKENRRVAILSETMVERLYSKDANVIGHYLTIDGSMYQIVGILKDNNSEYTQEILVPQTTLRLIYNRNKEADIIVMKTKGLEQSPAFQAFEAIYRKAMALKHNFSPDDTQAIYVDGGSSQAEMMDTAFGLIRSSFWFLGILTLLSGVTGVSNIMLISVKERTHEFGIRKALGAKPWQIILMVILESVLITTIFGYIGMLLGIVFCQWMDASVGGSTMDIGVESIQYFQDPTVGLDICIEATIIMIVAGAIAGFFPARKAAHIKPIEALQAR